MFCHAKLPPPHRAYAQRVFNNLGFLVLSSKTQKTQVLKKLNINAFFQEDIVKNPSGLSLSLKVTVKSSTVTSVTIILAWAVTSGGIHSTSSSSSRSSSSSSSSSSSTSSSSYSLLIIS